MTARAVTATTLLVLVAAVPALAASAGSDTASAGIRPETSQGAARLGARWLAGAVPAGGDGQSADTAVALRAAGRLDAADRRTRIAALRAGAPRYATTPGAAAKVALALVALDAAAPRCAGSVDLVARINAHVRGGRYGRTIFDQTLAMLAMRALGRPVAPAAVRWLRGARRGGGWSVLADQADDVSSTAMAMLALRAAGVRPKDHVMVAALRWINARRTPSGGFALGRRDRNEANSTALAIQAATAVGVRDDRAIRGLQGLQRPDGSFNFTATDAGSKVLASTDAVVALSGHAVPVARLARPSGHCI
jgi:hypothetical protein